MEESEEGDLWRDRAADPDLAQLSSDGSAALMKHIATLVPETGGRRKHVLKLIKLYNAHKGMPPRYILTNNTDIVLYGYCNTAVKELYTCYRLTLYCYSAARLTSFDATGGSLADCEM